MTGRYNIRLNCGRDIHLEVLYQYRTYRLLLEGIPNKRLNREIISNALASAKKTIGMLGEPLLIEPVETPLSLPNKKNRFWDTEEYQLAQIPSIICIAEFESYRPARDSDEFYSYLSIVWFQDEFALPIDPVVEEHIRGIDWNVVANDATD